MHNSVCDVFCGIFVRIQCIFMYHKCAIVMNVYTYIYMQVFWLLYFQKYLLR